MWIIVLVLMLILVVWLIVSYNRFVYLRNRSDGAFSTMDFLLTKRYDLIPKLIEIVKGYFTHEMETLEKVVRARSLAMSSTGIRDKQFNEHMLSSSLESLFAIAYSYPELKADKGFVQMQVELQSIEREISQSRKAYNATVKKLNIKTEIFPSSFIAGIFRFSRYPYFMLDESERQDLNKRF